MIYFQLALAFGLAAVGAAQTWTQLNPVGPIPPGTAHSSVVYDGATNRLIAFGGGLELGSGNNSVWVLSNANGLGGTPTWMQLTPTGPLPPRRMTHSGVYDNSTSRMIIFGGGVPYSAIYNDVWVLANASGSGGTPAWTQLAPSGTPPSPRVGHSAVYDAATNRMIIFGGCNVFPYCQEVNDTWILTNANGVGGTPEWLHVSPSGPIPPVRYVHTAAYDSDTNRMIIFGGDAGFAKYGDTWVLNNANGLGGASYWTQLSPSGNPPTRYNAPAGYDPAANQLIVTHGVTGGQCCGQLTTDSWSLSSADGIGSPAWQQLTVTGATPPARDGGPHTGALDLANRRLIIFGGSDSVGAVLNDVWVLAYGTVSDATPPVVTSAVAPAPVNGWNRAATTVTWSLSDSESGIASSSGCNTTMLTSETAGTTLACSATNGAGLSNSASATVKIDLTPPSISIASPANNSTVIVGSSASLSYACSDALSGVASCTGPVPSGGTVNFSTPGAQSFTVNASDVAGNTASASVSVNVAYRFTGFLPPIQNPPVFNSVRAGQSVPVKWQLQNSSGAYIGDLATFTSLTASPIACDSSPVSIVGDSVDASGGSSLRYDAASNQFVYNWQTPSTASGCWALQLTLKDGTAHLAKFTLR